jgi:hypothetical protein
MFVDATDAFGVFVDVLGWKRFYPYVVLCWIDCGRLPMYRMVTEQSFVVAEIYGRRATMIPVGTVRPMHHGIAHGATAKLIVNSR